LVLIDESHNLRNREGRRYKAIADYIKSCDAKVILLTATPYNKTKHDLSAQLRLFIDERATLAFVQSGTCANTASVKRSSSARTSAE
jgi:acetylornithine/succinyldiaminopimelate/putrescine aminotransferase